MNVMTRAHQIRSEAAEKFNCERNEVVWSECLVMAWEEVEEMTEYEMQVAKAEKIAELVNENCESCKVWTRGEGSPVRVYLDSRRGFIGIGKDEQVYISSVKRGSYQAIYDMLNEMGIEYNS